MTLLGQQELVVPVARRRLVVAGGHSAFWGVDVAVARVALGWCLVDAQGALQRGVRTVSLPDLSGGQRLAFAFEEIRENVMLGLRAGSLPLPGLIVVEQPSGKQINLPLAYMVGVVQGAVYAGAVLGGAVAPRTETITSSSWKKLACGRGNIFKPKRGDASEYGVLTWARENGYGGSSWDEADALGIAEAARRDVVLEQR